MTGRALILCLGLVACSAEELTESPTPVTGTCGNGVTEGTERCDGSDLDRASCELLGFSGGTLACNSDCELDISACELESCGNGTLESPEACDGTNLAGEDCPSLGFTGGALACQSNCMDFEPSDCSVCGDDSSDGSEVCDGTDLAGEDCTTQGLESGFLTCNDTCDGFDTDGCFGCGNDRAEGAEPCDGTDLAGEECSTQGFSGGTLACNINCDGFVTTGCFRCGNDVIDGDDVCDGIDLGGEDCSTRGFTDGTLACNDNCDGFVTRDCTECGNDIAEDGETCDGTDLNGGSCPAGGTILCNETCDGFDTDGCFGCGNNTIESPEVCDGSDLGSEDCSTQGFTAGTLACNGNCDGYVTTGCSTCNNGTIEVDEVCDGTDLDSEDCISRGFADGALACNADCDGFDTSACSDEVCSDSRDDDGDGFLDCEDPSTCQGVHPVCTPGAGAPGAPCVEHSDCAADQGDPICVPELFGPPAGYCSEFCSMVSPSCTGDGQCLFTGLPSGNGICHDGCVTPADCRPGHLCYRVAGVDVCIPHCTDDSQCTGFCNQDTGNCGDDDEICNNGGDDDGDSFADCEDLDCLASGACAPTCPDADLGSVTGAALSTGSTTTGVNENQSTCARSGARDLEFAWTAPAAGAYRFSTAGSSFDTVLSVLDSCSGTSLACSNDYLSLQSEVTLALNASQTVIVVVDGHRSATGDYSLTIERSELGRCGNATDDDGDTVADCNDPDCARDPLCVTCPDLDLASAIGAAVASGSTLSAPNDTSSPCGTLGGSDVQLQWTAPGAGVYVFDTAGSSFDTTLYLLDGCDGLALACNDDATGTASELAFELAASQTVIIVIDGSSAAEAGDWVLNITPP